MRFDVISNYPTNRENCIDFVLEKDIKYLIIPHTFNSNIEMPFHLSIYSISPIEVVELVEKLPTTSIQGKFTEYNSGGCTNYPSWRDNPQYIVQFNQRGKVSIDIEQPSNNSGPLQYIGYYLWISNDKGQRIVSSLNAIYQSPITNLAKVEGEFEVEPGTYILMPCTFNPHTLVDYTIKIIPEATNIQPVADSNLQILKGQWKSGSSGGCKNHNSWRNNPTFPITITGQYSQVFVVVSTVEKSPMGFYIFDPSLQNTIYASKFTNAFEVSASVDVESKDYVIMPCTFNPNIYKDFEVRVYYF